MTHTVDLWPEDLQVPEETSPFLILLEQAESLRKRTNGRVEARVYTRSLSGGKVSHHFDLQTPGPQPYTHALLEVVHARKQPYPAEVGFVLAVEDDGKVPVYSCNNQEELEKDLRVIFAAEHTRVMLDSLLVV